MLGLLAVAAVVVVVLTTRGASHSTEQFIEEAEDVSDDPHIFATHRYVRIAFKLCVVIIGIRF